MFGENPINPADGKIAVLLPGMGAVATTFIAGVEAARKGWSAPIGSVTQMGSDANGVPIQDLMPLAGLDQLVFGGWDIYPDTTFDAAKRAAVLNPEHLEKSKELLASITPMSAVFDSNYIKNIDGPNTKKYDTKWEASLMLQQDIKNFLKDSNCDRGVSVWCGSTERYVEISEVHLTIEAFEEGLKNNDPGIAPSMIYAHALLKSGVPMANGAPNLALDCPAIIQLAERENVAIAGKDFKTGQTLMKTIVAPGLAARSIGVAGWYSTNILGNTDGAVLDDPGSFKTKEMSKLSVLDAIFDKESNPDLYGDMCHKVRIDYYPPRGDNKEGWDNIDLFGWMGYDMQIKINFLCRDSILAAPLVLDLALFMDAANRANLSGVQEWLSFFFKAPQTSAGKFPEHDLFHQRQMMFDQIHNFVPKDSAAAAE